MNKAMTATNNGNSMGGANGQQNNLAQMLQNIIKSSNGNGGNQMGGNSMGQTGSKDDLVKDHQDEDMNDDKQKGKFGSGQNLSAGG